MRKKVDGCNLTRDPLAPLLDMLTLGAGPATRTPQELMYRSVEAPTGEDVSKHTIEENMNGQPLGKTNSTQANGRQRKLRLAVLCSDP